MRRVSRSARHRYLFAALALVAALPVAAHPGAQTRIARLDELIRTHPHNQALHLQRGGLYSHLGEWEPARRDLELARELGDPRAAGFELGLLHYRREQHTEAEAQFSGFLDLYPNHPQALLYRARTAQAAGDTGRALLDYRQHFKVQEQPHPGDYIAAAQMLSAPPTANTPAAISLLDQGMLRLGQQAQLQRYAIELEVQRGNLPGALQRCQNLQEVIGPGPQWQVEMAELLLMSERADEASVLLDTAQRELNAFRPTPARRELLARIDHLNSAASN